MAATPKVVLVLGAGPNVGQHIAKVFASKGYKVALTSRTAKDENDSTESINIAADLSDPNTVEQVFSKVKAALGIPSVVVYNGKQRPNE